MKFQIPSTIQKLTDEHKDRQIDRQTDKPKAICPSNFFTVGGIKTSPLKELKTTYRSITSPLFIWFIVQQILCDNNCAERRRPLHSHINSII